VASEGVQGILVELFSSEGCSSCPPADTLLRELDQSQPVPGAHVIAVELHVDYWNRLGWVDPFSSAEYTQRQGDYGRAFGKSGVYTPQMIVDGATELVGSNGKQAQAAIAAAAQNAHVPVGLARRGADVQASVGAPEGGTLEVFRAEVERELQTDVPRGENAGHTLLHGPVARLLAKVGVATPGAAFSAKVPAPSAPNRSLVVFAVDPTTHHVKGAAELR
jgi:hypothetical protein